MPPSVEFLMMGTDIWGDTVLINTGKGFQTPRTLSWPLRLTAGLLLAYMVLLVVAEIGPWMDIYSLFGPDRPVWVLSIFAMVVLANMLLWPVWCSTANGAMQPWVQPELKIKPLMAALWFIIPGAFIFMPWPVVRELYLASEDPLNWEDRKAPIVGWWWVLRVISYFAIWPLSILADSTSDGFIRTLMFQALIITELALQIFLVTRMTQWQVRPKSITAAEAF